MDVREKGHRWERKVAKELRDRGYDKAITSRANNKILDACKVDIDRVPFYIQCKSGYLRGINYSKLITEMRNSLRKEYGDIEYPLVIMHKKSGKYEDNLVIMPYDDFINLINKQKQNDLQRNTTVKPIGTEATRAQS